MNYCILEYSYFRISNTLHKYTFKAEVKPLPTYNESLYASNFKTWMSAEAYHGPSQWGGTGVMGGGRGGKNINIGLIKWRERGTEWRVDVWRGSHMILFSPLLSFILHLILIAQIKEGEGSGYVIPFPSLYIPLFIPMPLNVRSIDIVQLLSAFLFTPCSFASL